jgi:hypothetical protein
MAQAFADRAALKGFQGLADRGVDRDRLDPQDRPDLRGFLGSRGSLGT